MVFKNNPFPPPHCNPAPRGRNPRAVRAGLNDLDSWLCESVRVCLSECMCECVSLHAKECGGGVTIRGPRIGEK